MRLTVLGKSPSWQDAGGACSGYLVEENGTRVLLDCGNGVFAKLREHIDYVDVDAVVISHLHADHFLDLVPYSYALTYAPRQQPVPVHVWPGTDNPARPALHAPPGARETFRRVVGAWGNDDLIENAFDLTEYDPAEELDIGPIRIQFQAVPHFTETFAMSFTSTTGGGRLVYGADCRPTEDLVKFAKGASVVLLEATLPRPSATACAATSPRRRPASTRAPPAPRGSCSCTSRTSSIPSGRASRRRRSTTAPSRWPPRAPSTRSDGQELPPRPILGAMARSRDLFANFDRMRREIDELFGDVFERATGLRGGGFSPPVDVYYVDDPPRAVVKADLAGIHLQDIALEIRGRQLLIAGERRPAEAAGRLYQQIEIEHGPFRRIVELGAEVVADEAKASYEDGMLEVEIPLAPANAVRRVPIEEGEPE